MIWSYDFNASDGSQQAGLEVEQAQIFRARVELELWVLRPNKPEPVQITLEPASSPSFLLIKMLKFEFELTSSVLEKPRAWGPGVKNLARAFEPEPRLIPPHGRAWSTELSIDLEDFFVSQSIAALILW